MKPRHEYHIEPKFENDKYIGNTIYTNLRTVKIDQEYIWRFGPCVDHHLIPWFVPQLKEGMMLTDVPKISTILFEHKYWLIWAGLPDKIYPELFHEYINIHHIPHWFSTYISVRNYLVIQVSVGVDKISIDSSYTPEKLAWKKQEIEAEVLSEFIRKLNSICHLDGVFIPKNRDYDPSSKDQVDHS